MGRIGRMYLSAERIQQRVDDLSASILASGSHDLLLVSKLYGAFVFLSDLVRRLAPNVEVDFISLSRYGSTAGAVRVVKDLDQPVLGRHVLIVEDMIDTGLSLGMLVRHLAARDPASLRICTLLQRPGKCLVDLPVAFRGFEVGEEYLVGYGLDFLGLYRNLPCLVVVDDLHALHRDPIALGEDLRRMGLWSPATQPRDV